MGPGPAGSTDAVCVVAGGSPEPRSVEPPAAVCLGRPSRQRGALALGFVAGALGKPYASAQVGRVKPKPDLGRFFAYFARSRWRLLPSFFSALSRNFFSELLDLQPSGNVSPSMRLSMFSGLPLGFLLSFVC